MKTYYDNTHLCRECTGNGCKQCQGKGEDKFPLSLQINQATPPGIINFYGAKYLKLLPPEQNT